ncbi:MAG TPA: sugar ABC transporter permease [Thermomicrobiales bacterium]|nr:sugar ABC transporter permease [Thermomicrobiales bacterium]
MEPEITAVEVAPPPPKSVASRRFASLAAPKTAVGRQQERLGWLLVLPCLLVVFLVAIYPLFETFRLSFTNTRLASAREVRNVGWDNYRRLFEDDQWWRSLQNTLIFTITSVTIEAILGMIVALTIHSAFRGRGLVRTSMLVPWAIPTVVSSLLWSWMLNDTYGVINSIFIRLGLMDEGRNFAWVANKSTALGAMVAIDVWKTTPFMALLLLAGLQIIPSDVYEASYVDGASKWQQFWQMTLPLVKPALLVALIFRTMDAFRVFDLIYVLKQAATETMTVAIYTQNLIIGTQRIGAGSAAAVVVFICIGLMVLGYSRLVSVEEG